MDTQPNETECSGVDRAVQNLLDLLSEHNNPVVIIVYRSDQQGYSTDPNAFWSRVKQELINELPAADVTIELTTTPLGADKCECTVTYPSREPSGSIE